MIKIVYACNDKMFDGLYLSMLSILRRTKETIKFYILTGDYSFVRPQYTDFTNEHREILDKLAKKYNKNNEVNVVDCLKKSVPILKKSPNIKTNFSPYTLLRLFLDLFPCFDDKVLYIDVDTMACGDIKEFFNFNLGDNEFAACHNYSGKLFLKKDSFNAGVMLFNMPLCRKTKIFEKARNILTKKKYVWPDQTSLYKSTTKFMFFPADEFRFNRQQIRIRKGDILKHFSAHFIGWPLYNNIKQWDIKNVHRHLHIHDFDEDFKIYLNDKKNIEKEQSKNCYINVSHLRKSYGDLKAVDNISFKVKKGALFAFLGVNGAGKSTTINIISSTLYKDSGDITIDGYDLVEDNAKVKERIGIVFQNSALDDLLTVKENLEIRARFYKLTKADADRSIARVTDMLNLEPILNQPVGKLSGGQKRRVDIARALIHEPQLLMLDEPTTGLDPKTRLDVWKLIDSVRERTKMTVFLTTHYLEEADKASYVVIMDHGKIIAEGTPNELKNKYSSDTLISYQKKDSNFEKLIKKYPCVYDSDAGAYRISIKDSSDAKLLINKYNKYITDFEIQKGNMDSVFLNATKGVKR